MLRESTMSIAAMVRIGPWTIESIELGAWRNCDRCDARHKEVWICTVDADSDRLAVLDGRQTWHIGSTCGPTLMLVSHEVWRNHTKALSNAFRVLRRARKALAAIAQSNAQFGDISLILERTDQLARGELSEHLTRWLSSHVGRLERALRPRSAGRPA